MTSPFRLAIVALLALIELLLLVSSLYDYSVPIGQYGFLLRNDGLTISEVEPQKPAALAGVEPGDRIVYDSLTLFGRHIMTFKEPIAANAPFTFQLEHQGQRRTVTLLAQPMPMVYVGLTTIVSALSGFIFGVIGLILVVFRPTRMTWGFALIAPGLLLPSYFPLLAQHSESIAGAFYDIFISLIYAVQLTGMLIFASRFPNDKPHGLAAIVDYLSIPFGIIITVMYVLASLTLRFTTIVLPGWPLFSDCIYLLTGFAALAALISTYITTQGSIRSRLAPVLGSFVLLLVLGIMQQVVQDYSSSYFVLFAVFLSFAAAPTLVAITVAYGVVRYRVMDIDFILERTLVYTVLTAVIIFSFAVIDFIVGKLVEGRVEGVVQMAAAVIIGWSINYIHGKLDKIIRVFFFHRRYAARKQLSKSAQIIQHATSINLVDEMLVQDPSDALELASAAVFRRNGEDCYERVAAKGWEEGTAIKLAADDYLVTRLRAEMKPIKITDIHWPISNFPEGLAKPIYILPVLIGYQLEAILLYSGHGTGEDIDVDERKSLLALSRSASLAYGFLSRQKLHKELDTLQNKIHSLEDSSLKLENIILKFGLKDNT